MSDEQTPKKPKYEPPKLSPERLAELEEAHDDVLVLSGSEKAPWTVAVKRPNRQQTIAYKTHGKRDSTTANEQLLRQISVFPTGPDLDALLARWPFLPDGIAASDPFKDFLGITTDEQVKR